MKRTKKNGEFINYDKLINYKKNNRLLICGNYGVLALFNLDSLSILFWMRDADMEFHKLGACEFGILIFFVWVDEYVFF